MLDLETNYSNELETNNLYDNDFVYNIEQELSQYIECDICLGEPIDRIEDPRLLQMHSNERDFGKYLLKKGVIIFPEPDLIGLLQSPDFFVWKPNTQFWETPYSGFFYELTLCSKQDLEINSSYGRRKFARKRRQKETFENLGLPMIYMYREDQDRIRQTQPYSNIY